MGRASSHRRFALFPQNVQLYSCLPHRINQNQVLTFAQIRELYPNQWVLIGNPVLGDSFVESVVGMLRTGVVLLWGQDRKELSSKAMEAPKGFENVACVYTYEIPKNGK